MELDILQILSLLIVFVHLLLAAFLLTIKTKNLVSNLLLAAFLLVSAEDSDSIFIGGYIYPHFPALGMLINSLVLLKLPLIFLYLLSIVYSDFNLKWKHLLHALPFLIVNIVLIPRFYYQDFAGQMEYINSNTLSSRQIEIQLSYILVHTQIVVYLIASFLVINRYRRLLLENFSDANLFNYNWLFQLFTVFAIEAFVASLKNIFMFLEYDNAYFYSLLITSIIALFYITWMVFRIMLNPELFRGIDSKLQLVSNMVKEGEEQIIKTDPANNFNRNVNDKINNLNKYMVEEEPFLDPSLTIYLLSKKIDVSAKELSLLINHDLNQHFFDFVNSFRIRKAMEILSDPAKKDLTILEILYDVGFNSKSSFNTAFKKYTSLTPTQYRKKHLKSAA